MEKASGAPPLETRVPGLDGLRAVACLGVFGVHFQQITRLSGRIGPLDLQRLLENGNTGVCLFFLLTGFLLSLPTWTVARDFGAPSPPNRRWLGAYIRKRAARIFPAYFLCLAILVIVGGYFRGRHNLINVLLHVTFLHNAAEFSIYGIASHFWALAVIVQFYVVFPVLAAVLRRLVKFRALALTTLFAAGLAAYLAHAGLVHCARMHEHDWPLPPSLVRPYGYVLTHTLLAHLPHFLLGMLAAGVFVTVGRDRSSGPDARLFGLAFWLAAGLMALILSVPELDDWLSIPYGRYNLPYVPVLAAALVVCAPYSTSASAVLTFAPVRLLGTISYGVYIYHPPCLSLVASEMRKVGLTAGENWALFGMAGLALTVAVAAVSYVLMERPILGWAKGRQAAQSLRLGRPPSEEQQPHPR
jgi:peptidoglycan/LPS O-acetylase OafA/YrhL